MTVKIDILVGAETYNIYDGDEFIVQNEGGLGMSPSHLIMDRSPLQDGIRVRDFRLDPREITLGVWARATNETDHFARREELIQALKLSTTPNRLRYTFSDGRKRQIDFYYNGGMDFPTGARPVYHQKSVIRLFCPDPLFYDPVGKSLTFASGGSATESFTVSHAVPHKVGSSGLSVASTKRVAYGGSWKVYPRLIRITGPITNPVIRNKTLNLVLDFTGTTIAAGDYYDIDLRFGYKTVTDSNDANQVSKLTNDSDLADWHIGAEPNVPGGDNSISVSGTSTTEATKVELSYNERFVGF